MLGSLDVFVRGAAGQAYAQKYVLRIGHGRKTRIEKRPRQLGATIEVPAAIVLGPPSMKRLEIPVFEAPFCVTLVTQIRGSIGV